MKPGQTKFQNSGAKDRVYEHLWPKIAEKLGVQITEALGVGLNFTPEHNDHWLKMPQHVAKKQQQIRDKRVYAGSGHGDWQPAQQNSRSNID